MPRPQGGLVYQASAGQNLGFTPVFGSTGAASSVANAHVDAADRQVMEEAVAAINMANRKSNTAAAYDPKSIEWDEFCRHAHAGEHDAMKFIVTGDKLAKFLRYHAFRNKRKQGGRKKGYRAVFDGAEYDSIVQSMAEHLRLKRANPEHEIPDPEDPIGYDLLNTYTSTVYNIYCEQRRHGANALPWEMIRKDPNVAEVLAMVKRRKGRIKRAKFEEKLDEQFQPFQSVEQVPKIERSIWDYGKSCRKTAFVALRSRMTFLWCYSGVLRCESLFLGELSDLFDFSLQRDDHSDAMDVVVLQMRTGKTVDSMVPQYGRAMRHKDVMRCAVGSLALYLLFRFDYSGEMDEGHRPDFLDNSAWFNIKLLTDGSRNRMETRMQPRSYTDVMKMCFKNLSIFTHWLSHWGRHYASAEMEMMDCPDTQQERLGKWFCFIYFISFSGFVSLMPFAFCL
jgi:hypothetical protein